MHGGSRPPDQFELTLQDDRRIELRLIGPSAQGWVCTTRERDACYRLLPIAGGFGGPRECEDAPVERRQRFRQWMANASGAPSWTTNPAARHLAPIIDDGQSQLSQGSGQGWYYVRYDVRHATSLAEILAGNNPHERLDAVLIVLYQMQTWWQDLRFGLIPFPADIVFDAEKRPFLLPAPPWVYPDIGSVFAEPARTLFLAPEYLRGVAAAEPGMTLDCFALGAICLQVFRRPQPVSDARTGLIYAATGALWENATSNLPLWLQRLRSTAEAQNAVRRLIAPDPTVRASIDLRGLVQTLERCRKRMEPQQVVREHLDTGRATEIYEVLHDILLVDNSCPMLMLAGEAALQAGRPLEAVDFLEQAITHAYGDTTPVRRQFELLASDDWHERIEDLIKRQPELGVRLDDKMWRNFCTLDADDDSTAWENDYVDYLLWRELYAVDFIYSRLFDAQKTFLWWKFPLRFRYVRALFLAGVRLSADGRADDGSRFIAASGNELEAIKAALYAAHRDNRLTPEQREFYFSETHELEELLLRLRHTGYAP